MKPEAQRIAIAEACGWNSCGKDSATEWYLSKTDSALLNMTPIPWDEISKRRRHLPDYLNDLNAIHEAEKILTKEQHWKFINELCRLTGAEWADSYEEVMRVAHATAAQRSEAILFTLGKWNDTK